MRRTVTCLKRRRSTRSSSIRHMLGAAPIVADTWQKVVDAEIDLAGLFYSELFRMRPDLRARFAPDLRAQRAKFVHMMGQIVIALHAPEALLPSVRALGARHAYYQVDEEHYQVVGEALVRALSLGLGGDFTPEAERAWQETYTELSDVMISAARSVVSAAR